MSTTALQYKFHGTLTSNDCKTYVPYSFDVPENTSNIHIDFEFSPLYATGRIHRNQINISLNDPDGIRGVCNIIREEGVDVNAIASTPGIRTAEIQAGTWTVFVDVHRILSPDTVHYDMTVTLSDEALSISPQVYDGSQRVAKKETGWYWGDLHAHTIHSDGHWDVPEFTKFMRAIGLDFVTLSDHNTVTGLAQHRSQTEDGFLAMGGMELSTFYGHMLALGGNAWYEWRLNITEGMDIKRIMQQVIDAGEMLIIAHPMAVDEPFCSGCHWQYETARPGVALGVEIWNGFWDEFNNEALQQYYAWLNLGLCLVATSGTDIHGPHPLDTPHRPGFNVVYAEELSEVGILTAVRKGHSYVSGGPELLFTAQTASGQSGMVGDLLPAEDVTVNVVWNKAHEGDILRLILDGKVYEQAIVGENGDKSWSFKAGDLNWVTLELRDAKYDLWAVANPIFFGER